MRRALSALAVTVVGVVWIVTFKVTPVPVDASSQLASSLPTSRSSAPNQHVPTQPTTTTAQGGGGTYTGSVIRTVYGDVQVKVTVSGNKIMDVQPLTLPSDRARSAYISQVAGPMLRTEAITAQSSNIDIISGATYTSIAYQRSLDSALKQAHLG